MGGVTRPLVAALLAAVSAVACSSGPLWQTTRNPDALDAARALAYDYSEPMVGVGVGVDVDARSPLQPLQALELPCNCCEPLASAPQRDLRADEVPVVPVRRRLRPCCAFGSALQVRVGMLDIPGFAIENIRSPDGIGHHNYDAGRRGSEVAEGGEDNGLVYTCRGGFIDIAHVRDYADWTLFLASEIGRHLETGKVIELPDGEGGRRRFVLQQVPAEQISAAGRRQLSSSLAVWAAFQMSVWHEIATWYGWASFSVFSERASAFSPEDLYSNLLGAKLVVPIIEARANNAEGLFNRSVDVWLVQALAFLGGVEARLGEQAMWSVDQHWWNSSARLPDQDLVMRRSVQLGSLIEPWQVPATSWAPGLQGRLRQSCGDMVPQPLRNPSRIPGLAFEDVLSFEVELGDEFAALDAFREIGPVVSQRDFERIVDQIRAEVIAHFGPLGDTPEIAESLPVDGGLIEVLAE